MLSRNTILQNRYRVVRELGHGGMGTVYEAVDQRVNCIVALKETIAGNDEEARRAFEREASLLGNLRHSALPKVMDYFTEGGGDFLVMEFIPGYDLAELLESRESPFPQSQVLRWADELLKVLEYLHKQDPPILHRDIKPSNLKLTKQGEIFLLDFGLAKGSLGQMATLATSRSVRGYTPVYASLEQIHGHGTDARSDIYSLGATLYHLLSGVAPIDAPTRFHFVEDDQPDPLPSISSRNPQASSNVAAVIAQAMAISRKQRLVSAAEMRKALRNAAEEDERYSAEEEYARAEVRGREREEERRRATEEAAERSEEDRLLQEAETRKKEEEVSRQEAERKRREAIERQREEAERQRREAREADAKEAEEKVARRRAEAAERAEEDARRRRANLPPTVKAPPGPTVAAAGQSPPPTERPISTPAIKTIPAPPPERLTTGRDGAAFAGNELTRTSTTGSKRVFVIAAGVLAVAIVGAIILWSGGTSTTNLSLSNTGQPSKQAGNEPPAGMVYVPGGEFMMGRDDGDEYERPAHRVTVKPFFIDIYEVTNEEYLLFVQATGSQPPETWIPSFAEWLKAGKPKVSYPTGTAHRPVTGVAWDDANAYARWAHKRLPTEDEWEFAARGTDGRRYPWGNDWQDGLANVNNAASGSADVGTYNGASPFGAYDMVGNAWEWTKSDLKAYPGGSISATVAGQNLKVIRGNMYGAKPNQATTTFRRGWPERGADYRYTGFRCAMAPPNI